MAQWGFSTAWKALPHFAVQSNPHVSSLTSKRQLSSRFWEHERDGITAWLFYLFISLPWRWSRARVKPELGLSPSHVPLEGMDDPITPLVISPGPDGIPGISHSPLGPRWPGSRSNAQWPSQGWSVPYSRSNTNNHISLGVRGTAYHAQ